MDINELMDGSDVIARFMFAFADSMALKCAVELRIADIMHSHNEPITLCEIIKSMGLPESADINCLERVMRFLVHRKIFTADYPTNSDNGEVLYGMTNASRWMLRDAELSMAPFILLENDQRMAAPMQFLSMRIRGGGDCFERAHGMEFWEYCEKNQSFFEFYQDGMTSMAKIISKVVSLMHNRVFEQLVGTLVDVGGGTGTAVAGIVEAHPHIKGINFDLPHVISTAPNRPGVTHVGGNMFETIPAADTILMKSVLHDWGDEDCIKILKNCLKSIPEDTGKVILLEMILSSEAKDKVDINLFMDLVMMAHHTGGKERTDRDWKGLLYAAGFKRINIVNMPLLSIIEAYPC